MGRTIGGIKIPDKDCYKIQSTFKYEIFQFIEGNRDIDHEERIEKSIRKSGLLIQPILVNQNMQIIEGQNRYQACKKLGLPIYYVIQNDIGLEEVKSLNSASKNWTTQNYIHSFAAGNRQLDYVYVEQLIKAYPWVGFSALSFAIRGVAYGGTQTKMIREGKFQCDELEYNKAVSALEYLSQVKDEILSVGGRKEYYMIAIMFCFYCEDIDNEYLITKFKKYYKSLKPINDIMSALEQIETKIYNYQMRSPREPISISTEYKRARRATRNKRKED